MTIESAGKNVILLNFGGVCWIGLLQTLSPTCVKHSMACFNQGRRGWRMVEGKGNSPFRGFPESNVSKYDMDTIYHFLSYNMYVYVYRKYNIYI